MKNLDDYIPNYTEFNAYLIRKRYEHFKQFFRGNTALELGAGDGTGTKILSDYFKHLAVVDASQEALSKAKEQAPDAHTFLSTFEDLTFPPHQKWQTILLAHVLEHVDDPQAVLQTALSLLSPSGVLIVSVPNADSLHRQIGVELNLLKERTELNETDHSLGHQRVYTYTQFQEEIITAPIRPADAKFGGMFLKTLSNAQMQEIYTEEELDALFTVGVNNPRISAEIYAIITP